ncbi:MAG: hypothetical protein V1847_04490 [Candidatus Diapherotrites archaeon]
MRSERLFWVLPALLAFALLALAAGAGQSCSKDSECLPSGYSSNHSCLVQYRCLEGTCSKVELSCSSGSCFLCQNDDVCGADECYRCPDCVGKIPESELPPEAVSGPDEKYTPLCSSGFRLVDGACEVIDGVVMEVSQEFTIVLDENGTPSEIPADETIIIDVQPSDDETATEVELSMDENEVTITVPPAPDENVEIAEDSTATTEETVTVEEDKDASDGGNVENPGKKLKLGKHKKEVKTLPDKAKGLLKRAEKNLQVDKMKLRIETDEKTKEEKVKYDVEGKEKGKLLGILPVEISVQAVIDSDNGKVEKVDKPFWALLVFTEPPAKVAAKPKTK